MAVLSSLISDARYTVRLVGLVRLIKSALVLKINSKTSQDKFLSQLSFLQIGTLIMHQGLQNIFYLVAKGLIPKPSIGNLNQVNRLRLWSSRCLLCSFLTNLVKLVHEAWINKDEKIRPSNSIDEDGLKTIGSKDAKSRVSERRKFTS